MALRIIFMGTPEFAVPTLQALHDAGHEDVRMLAFDYKRYVGAQIGIYNPAGKKVGKVSHLRNTEYIFIAGPSDRVDAAAAAATAPTTAPRAATAPAARQSAPQR